jgi:ADP-heptose:LPS heptosyltransferase
MDWLAHVGPRSVAVFRALQLGDLLCALPALRALRRTLPKAHIALVGLPWAQSFAARFPGYIDEFIAFPGFPGLPERAPDVQALPAFLAAMHARRFDLALQLHGDRSNDIVALFGARRRAGFCPSASALGEDGFVRWPGRGPEVLRLLGLVEALGARRAGTQLEFPLHDEDRAELVRAGLAQPLEHGDYACLHPGARSASKRWSVNGFAAVGRWLHRQGLRLVITGSAAEHALACRLADALGVPSSNAAAPISVGALAALIGGSGCSSPTTPASRISPTPCSRRA